MRRRLFVDRDRAEPLGRRPWPCGATHRTPLVADARAASRVRGSRAGSRGGPGPGMKPTSPRSCATCPGCCWSHPFRFRRCYPRRRRSARTRPSAANRRTCRARGDAPRGASPGPQADHPSTGPAPPGNGLPPVVARHAYIWFVLAFAFLPLYLMLIVSFKTNTQFYQRARRPHASAPPGELAERLGHDHPDPRQQRLSLRQLHRC